MKVVVSCEHASRAVPSEWRHVLDPNSRVVQSHQAYDRGALELARTLSQRLGTPLIAGRATRLLIDLNRPLNHPRVFSKFTRGLSVRNKQRLELGLHRPYWTRVSNAIESALRHEAHVLHLSIHSFTPRLGGRTRTAHLGLLYDPSRARERALCSAWQSFLAEPRGAFSVRRNYPYQGASSGLTTSLRRKFEARRYLGIELEVNQKLVRRAGWREALAPALLESLHRALRVMRRHRVL